MKILLDENLHQDFVQFIPGHTVSHVVTMGWEGKKNGELLKLAEDAGFQVFLTADKNMPYQQSMKGKPFPLVVLDIHPNVLANQVACVALIDERLRDAEPGEVYIVEGPHSRRRGM